MPARAAALIALLMMTTGAPATQAPANIVTSAQKPDTLKPARDPGKAAKRFIQHINYARVALAMKNPSLAREHIVASRVLLWQLRRSKSEQREVTTESGKIHYATNTKYKDYYYPIETGPVEFEKLDKAPFWTSKDTLAVTDASIVYMTLDVRSKRAEKYLRLAERSIDEGKLAGADRQLAALSNDIVHISDKKPLSQDVARDNIALARGFLSAGNYDGARFALKHADNALENLEIDEAYKTHRTAIAAMRREVNDMQKTIRRDDPTILEKTGQKMEAWRQDIKSWASN